jgi:hypothetical protein
LWQLHFGRGLVRTAEEFGTQGEAPTHPELLDWLARRFVASGWNVKALNKVIVMSAAYRQDSTERPGDAETDPANTWLARGVARRLSAEMIRDNAVACSTARWVARVSIRTNHPASGKPSITTSARARIPRPKPGRTISIGVACTR